MSLLAEELLLEEFTGDTPPCQFKWNEKPCTNPSHFRVLVYCCGQERARFACIRCHDILVRGYTRCRVCNKPGLVLVRYI